jgi:hypothetical protein
MDIHQLKQRIDASGKKLLTLGNEYIKSKDEIAARKVLVKMFGEISLRHCCWVNKTLRWIGIRKDLNEDYTRLCRKN